MNGVVSMENLNHGLKKTYCKGIKASPCQTQFPLLLFLFVPFCENCEIDLNEFVD